ncbi:UDP-N-acetylmuramoyl-tripeptide--D-alanyl-D-alanine ligase [Candidatus Peregrinibacteria bacterium]|nr:UDP-N-acetylmuramoyl-tripeptide--D-alanyl-D-alanine ligase [Candidatus Peregrinibacteria bacterium]
MKFFFKFIIGMVLSIKAKQYLRKHRTQVIGITGSIGKTSTKEAVYQILKNHFNVYSSKKSFNTKLGLSLAVLQEEESGFSSIRAWFSILKRVLFDKKLVYQKMVLEMGADHAGDIKKLVKIAKPKIGVITNIAPVHLNEGQFNDIYDIAKEKETLVKMLPKDGVAILNYDDPLIRDMKTNAQKITFGLDPSAMVRAHDIKMTNRDIHFTVTYKDESEEFVIPVLGKFQVYVFLPAIAVALVLGMKIKECSEVLNKFSLPAGRMNPILGLNKSMIIDGSYNASPVTMKSALELMDELKADRKIAALGTMNELGEISKESHFKLGRSAASFSDILIAVGPEASTIKQGALDAEMSEDKIFTFLDSEEAGYFLKDKLEPKDLILVKGSQNHVRMEKFVKVIMAEPEKAPELLCRQGEAWENI